jgi:NADPH2:quinone reductase
VRAWRFDTNGEPRDVLHLDDDVPPPQPGPGQVAIDVDAVGLNFADSLLCKGTYQVKPPLPATPGMEVVGRVVGTGERVVAITSLPHGGLAERCIAEAADVWAAPDHLRDPHAVALPINYGTAWIGLFHRGELQPGQTVLVHAAAGGTGSAAVQLAAKAGAVVLATAGGPAKASMARQLGATYAWDSRADGFDLVEEVRAVTDGRGVDVVFDPVGGDLFDASRRVVAFEGRYLVVGFASGRIPDAPANHLLVKNYALVGVHWGLYRTNRPDLVRRAWDAILDAGVEPMIGGTQRFEQALDGLDQLASGATAGKVVVYVR